MFRLFSKAIFSLTTITCDYLTPYSRVLPDKLTVPHLVKKLSAFYGTRRFITAFTRACHLSLSWAETMQSMSLHTTSWRFILILSSTYANIFQVTIYWLPTWCTNYYHHQSFMELGHLLTRSSLTHPEVSLTVYHDFFCQLGNIVS